jgi:DNA-binding MarR family transcriptional regulator
MKPPELIDLRRSFHHSKDDRRVLLSVTEPGLEALRDKHSARIERMANVLTEDFSRAEFETLHAADLLIERLG